MYDITAHHAVIPCCAPPYFHCGSSYLDGASQFFMHLFVILLPCDSAPAYHLPYSLHCCQGRTRQLTFLLDHHASYLPTCLLFQASPSIHLRSLAHSLTHSLSRSLARCILAGPGLAVRVLGDVTEGDALDVLRHVDEVYVQTIRDYGLYDKIWQAFAVFLPVR